MGCAEISAGMRADSAHLGCPCCEVARCGCVVVLSSPDQRSCVSHSQAPLCHPPPDRSDVSLHCASESVESQPASQISRTGGHTHLARTVCATPTIDKPRNVQQEEQPQGSRRAYRSAGSRSEQACTRTHLWRAQPRGLAQLLPDMREPPRHPRRRRYNHLRPVRAH